MNIIAIDCGASFLKAALFCNGEIIREKSCKSPKVHGEENVFLPIQIEELVSRVKSVLFDLSDGLAEVVVCLSNEMHGFILAHEDGTPFTDYISWQKEFGNNIVDGISSKTILEKEEYAEQILRSGMPVRAGLPSSNLLFLNRSHAFEKVSKSLFFYTLGDYIIRRITGDQPICHITNAAATGLFDLLNNKWNESLIRIVCDEKIIFPKIGTEFVEAKIDKCTYRFLPAIGDQQAALYGAGVVEENELSFNLGTGAQVSRITSELNLSERYQTRPYMEGKFIRTIPHLPSGRAMNVYVRFIQDVLSEFQFQVDEAIIWDKIIKSANKCEYSSLVCDLSFFDNPINDKLNGSIHDISEYGLNTGALFKGIFNAMIENFLWASSIIQPQRDLIKKIVFSGGVAKKIDYIRERIADYYCDAQLEVAPDKETLYGLQYYAQNMMEGRNE